MNSSSERFMKIMQCRVAFFSSSGLACLALGFIKSFRTSSGVVCFYFLPSSIDFYGNLFPAFQYFSVKSDKVIVSGPWSYTGKIKTNAIGSQRQSAFAVLSECALPNTCKMVDFFFIPQFSYKLLSLAPSSAHLGLESHYQMFLSVFPLLSLSFLRGRLIGTTLPKADAKRTMETPGVPVALLLFQHMHLRLSLDRALPGI